MTNDIRKTAVWYLVPKKTQLDTMILEWLRVVDIADMHMLKFLENALQISSEPCTRKKEMDANLEVESISHVVGVNICIYIL